MTIPRFAKYAVLGVCAVGFITTASVGFWPAILYTTRIPLYAAEVGAWCIFATVSYLVVKFVLAGLRRSKT